LLPALKILIVGIGSVGQRDAANLRTVCGDDLELTAYAVHGLLVIGPPVAVADIHDCAANPRTFTITLARNGEQQATGGGEQVLGSPLLAFAHLAEVLANQSRFSRVRAGEVVTAGTLTELFPVTTGESWSTALEGIDLPGMSVTLA
jgi:2-keto-4-pentenoate hydratase